MALAPFDRRGFLSRLGRWTLGGLALAWLPGCDKIPAQAAGAADDEPEDDFGMHGPVKVATQELELPSDAAALALFAPFDDGTPFLRRWALSHVARGHQDQIVIVMEDTETGGHAEVEIYALETTIDPVAFSDLYGVIVDNGGRGDAPTPLHLRRLAARLAEIVGTHEHDVALPWQVPTLPEAAARTQIEDRERSWERASAAFGEAVGAEQ